MKYYEPWRNVLKHIQAPVLDVDVIKDGIIFDSSSHLHDNYRQLRMLGCYLKSDSDEYFVDKEDLNRARDSANAAEREFRQELEFAYTNDRISEADKERLSALLEYRDLFYDREDFACWKAYLTALEKQIEEISETLTTAKTVMDDAVGKNSNAAEAFAAAQSVLIAAKTAYELSLENTFEGIDDSKSLEAEIKKVEGRISAFEQAEKTVADGINAATSALSAAKQRKTDALSKESSVREKMVAEAKKWAAALAEKGFSDEAAFLASLKDKEILVSERTAIATYDADLRTAQKAFDEQQKKTDGLVAPEMKALQDAKTHAESAWKEKNDTLTTASQKSKDMQKLYESLSKRWEKYQVEKTIADSNTDFARKLNSSTGLSLQRYVLGIMLTSITVAANQLLKTVRGGRYQLYRRYESSGRALKAGLELDVLDTSNGEKRSVTTLSGGEKFLLALSLAIGLSTVVQAQSGGTRLDAKP